MTSRSDYNNPHGSGELGLPYHYEMVSDRSRVGAFRRAIEATCADRVVLESGTGTGILALLAARAGARHVYTVEIDPTVAAHARANIERSGLSRVELIEGSTLDLVPERLTAGRPEVVIAENLSTWQVTEPQLQVINHIKESLAAPGAVYLPERIFNTLELARSQYRFEDLIDLRTQYFVFSGIQEPERLCEPTLFARLDLGAGIPVDFEGTVEVVANRGGVVNSLRLTSPVQVHGDIRFEGSDSLMPPVVVPIDEDLDVRAGDRVKVSICYRANSDWTSFRCRVASARNRGSTLS